MDMSAHEYVTVLYSRLESVSMSYWLGGEQVLKEHNGLPFLLLPFILETTEN